MKRMFSAALAALTLGVASLAPAAPAYAEGHRGDYSRNWDGNRGGGRDWDRGRGRGDRNYYDNRSYYGGGGHRHRHRDNDDDAIVAGVVGLALGAIIGSALSQPAQPSYAPPPRQQYYQDDGYYEQGRTCYRRERQYDRYAGRNVIVDVPYSC